MLPCWATATRIDNLVFGKKYQWRYAGIHQGKKGDWIGPFHFETVGYARLEKGLVSVTITQNDSSANAGGLIIDDCSHRIMDRNGKVVWLLRKVKWHTVGEKEKMEIKPRVLDLRLTPAGTITYMADTSAVECDLSGKMLWRAPDNGKVSGFRTEFYNHHFERLPNDHYIVLSREWWRKIPPYRDSALVGKKYSWRTVIGSTEYGRVNFPTIIEYDKKGHVVWSWKSMDYLDSNALSPIAGDTKAEWESYPHGNALSVDKNDEYVYMGLRNMNRIIKIEKKTGKVVDSWGARWPGTGAMHELNLKQQHDTHLLDDGSIAVYNSNNYPGSDSSSRALIFSQKPGEDGKVLWSFDCDFDSLDRHSLRKGGNVDRLKNGNYLICTGMTGRILEVTEDKKIVWQCRITVNDKNGPTPFHWLYRAHCISSLYPCYFTMQPLQDTINAAARTFNIRIFNKGSESDTYDVQLSSSSGWTLPQFSTDMVGANSSITIPVNLAKSLIASDKILVVVTSKTNPDFERKSWVVVGK